MLQSRQRDAKQWWQRSDRSYPKRSINEIKFVTGTLACDIGSCHRSQILIFFFFCSYAKIRVEIWFSDFLLGYASRCCFLYYQNLYIGISLHRIATTTRPTKIIISMTRVKTFRINKIVLWIHIDDNYNYHVAKASNRFNIESEVFEGWYKEIIKSARLRIIAITVGSVRGHAA